MTLLIDPPNAAGHGRMWSHLVSDTSFEELHAFAASLGIPRRGFDRDHYDIPAERYAAVVAAGARPVDSRVLLTTLRRAGLRRRKADVLGPRGPGRQLARAPRLAPGDTVAVVAPAGPVPPDRLAAGIAVLGSWGLDVRVLEHVRADSDGRSFPAHLAAADADRADDFMRAWCDPHVRAVLCARGGFGAHRMLDLLDWQALAAAGPKVLVGFSDITALHQAVAAELGLSTLHGPVVASLGSGDRASQDHLRRMLMEPAEALELVDHGRTRVGGRAEGVLVGGNLAVLAAGIGTPHSVTATDSIVVLEDVTEPVYRIDRLLTQLLRSGWLTGARGVVLGDFDAAAGDLDGLLADRLGGLGVPVLADAPFGHGPRNLAFPLGLPAVLDADAGTLRLRGPALA